ncbi:VOC family protein [Aliikangiella coralliicola]|uniref:VOC family protein n=1 Tax=Aliikangiella coralliicola TaxID=2592383 RepID=UPI00143D7EEE|nr:VOC family protein [Aliikangiella coralliicola]
MAKITHVDIAGIDGGKLKSFYGDLFDWNITRRDIPTFDYYDIETEGELTAGIRHEPEGRAEITIYIEVDDVEAYVEKAKSLGVNIRIPPMQYGDLKFAVIEDPEKNPVGLTQAKSN